MGQWQGPFCCNLRFVWKPPTCCGSETVLSRAGTSTYFIEWQQFLFSKKNCGTSGSAAKLHLHFVTSPAECTTEWFCVTSNCSRVTGVLVHRPDMALWGINFYISQNLFLNKRVNLSSWRGIFCFYSFCSWNTEEQTKIQLQKISRHYVYLWGAG